ncbi:MAG: hypothetical protein WA126_07510 [Thermodesulfovibrionales bacterium]
MQWYEIIVILPLRLLESAYNFLWLYVNGIAVEKKEKDFLLRAYIFSSYPHDLLKRLNNFLKIQAKTIPPFLYKSLHLWYGACLQEDG